MTSQLAEKVSEIEELKAVVEGRKQDQKKLAAGMTEIEQLNQTIERYIHVIIQCVRHCFSVVMSFPFSVSGQSLLSFERRSLNFKSPTNSLRRS